MRQLPSSRRVSPIGTIAWNLEVYALRDGDKVTPHETVMLITGPYLAFARLETVYLGVMARRTRVATNTRGSSKQRGPNR